MKWHQSQRTGLFAVILATQTSSFFVKPIIDTYMRRGFCHPQCYCSQINLNYSLRHLSVFQALDLTVLHIVVVNASAYYRVVCISSKMRLSVAVEVYFSSIYELPYSQYKNKMICICFFCFFLIKAKR